MGTSDGLFFDKRQLYHIPDSHLVDEANISVASHSNI